jgi:hypothetical protein
MAKAIDLLADIKRLPDQKFGKDSWIDRLAKKDPALYAEVLKVVDLWLDGDQAIRRKLPSQTAVCEWLSPLLIARNFHVASQTVNQIFPHRRGQRNGEAAK